MVGYKLLVGGRNEGSGVLVTAPLEVVTKFELRFDHGAVRVLLDDGHRIEVNDTGGLALRLGASGTAEFQIDGFLAGPQGAQCDLM